MRAREIVKCSWTSKRIISQIESSVYASWAQALPASFLRMNSVSAARTSCYLREEARAMGTQVAVLERDRDDRSLL